jgi:hypothetical protein
MLTARQSESEEWVLVDDELALRQGDILVSRDRRDGVIHGICVVLTADCDFAQGNKFGINVAALAIQPYKVYLAGPWADARLKKLLSEAEKTLHSQFARHARSINAGASISIGAMNQMLERQAASAIVETFKLEAKEGRKFERAIEDLRATRSAAQPASPGEPPAEALSRCIALRDGCAQEQAKEKLLQQARQISLPDDVFFLCGLPQLDGEGFVVLLRNVLAIPFEQITISAEAAVDATYYLRLGRLKPTFKHAVSQSFGWLYSRIGLPANQETQRDSIIKAAPLYWVAR